MPDKLQESNTLETELKLIERTNEGGLGEGNPDICRGQRQW